MSSTILVDGKPATSNATTVAQNNLRMQKAINPRHYVSLNELYRASGSPEGKSPPAWLEMASPLLAGFGEYHQAVHERFFPGLMSEEVATYEKTQGAWQSVYGDLVADVEVAMAYALFLDNQGMLEMYIGGDEG